MRNLPALLFAVSLLPVIGCLDTGPFDHPDSHSASSGSVALGGDCSAHFECEAMLTCDWDYTCAENVSFLSCSDADFTCGDICGCQGFMSSSCECINGFCFESDDNSACTLDSECTNGIGGVCGYEGRCMYGMDTVCGA